MKNILSRINWVNVPSAFGILFIIFIGWAALRNLFYELVLGHHEFTLTAIQALLSITVLLIVLFNFITGGSNGEAGLYLDSSRLNYSRALESLPSMGSGNDRGVLDVLKLSLDANYEAHWQVAASRIMSANKTGRRLKQDNFRMVLNDDKEFWRAEMAKKLKPNPLSHDVLQLISGHKPETANHWREILVVITFIAGERLPISLDQMKPLSKSEFDLFLGKLKYLWPFLAVIPRDGSEAIHPEVHA